MQSPKVAIGCVVRNRAWILPEYLAALEAIDHPEKAFLFLENDSADDTLSILHNYPYSNPALIKNITTGAESWDRGDYSVNQYANLAEVRNTFIEAFLDGSDGFISWILDGAEYLLSIDSDIIVPPDILTRLLPHANQNTIMGAVISNIPGQPLDGSTPGNFMIEHNGMMIHPNPYPLSGLMDVDVIGAVYLIPRKALEMGVRYAAHPQGEDIPFCISARQMGISMRVMMDLVCDHRMTKP